MGFLDPKEQVIDMVLTSEGQKQFAKGNLRFVYWSVFDDEVDYDPFIANSGSITKAEVTSSKVQQTENGPVREATTGYRGKNNFALDRLNVYRPLFTVPQGHTIVPKVIRVHRTASNSINMRQQKIIQKYFKRDRYSNTLGEDISADIGYKRIDASEKGLEYKFTPNTYSTEYPLEGFKVTVFHSGSGGLTELDPRFDLEDEISFGSELKLVTRRKRVKI